MGLQKTRGGGFFLEDIWPMTMGSETNAAWWSDERRETLTVQALRTAADRIRELEVELGLVREALAHREAQIQSLQNSLDLNVMENLRLSGRIAESFTAINEAHSRLEPTKQALLAAQAERDEANERCEAEIRSLTAQLDAMSVKAVTAEQEVAEARQIVLACIGEKYRLSGQSAMLSARFSRRSSKSEN